MCRLKQKHWFKPDNFHVTGTQTICYFPGHLLGGKQTKQQTLLCKFGSTINSNTRFLTFVRFVVRSAYGFPEAYALCESSDIEPEYFNILPTGMRFFRTALSRFRGNTILNHQQSVLFFWPRCWCGNLEIVWSCYQKSYLQDQSLKKSLYSSLKAKSLPATKI